MADLTDMEMCVGVFVIGLTITGIAFGGIGTAVAGAGGGAIAGTVICSIGGANAVRSIRDMISEPQAGVDDLVGIVEESRSTIVAAIGKEFSLDQKRAAPIYDRALAWIKGNPGAARSAYTRLATERGGAIAPLPPTRTAELTKALARLAAT